MGHPGVRWAGLAVALWCAVGCGGGGRTSVGTSRLDLQALPAVEMASGTQLRIKFVVLRADESAPLTFSVTGLPSYGRQDGDVLVLTPGPTEEGASEVSVTVTDGTLTDTERFHLRVARPNTAPVVSYAFIEDFDGTLLNPYDPPNVARGTPTLHGFIAEPDNEALELLVEVVPLDAEYRGQPTHRFPLTASGNGVSYRVEVTGLQAGAHVKARAWAVDARGASGPYFVVWRDLVLQPRGERPAGPVLATCGGASVDVATDARHCGGCDFSCGAAACVRGVCEAQVVARSTADGPRSLAVNDDSVFWAHSKHVTRIPKTGGDGVVISPPGVGGAMVLDGTELYFGYDALTRLSLTTGETRPLMGRFPYTRLVVHDGHLYWNWADQLQSVAVSGAEASVDLERLATFPTDLRGGADGLYVGGDTGVVLARPWTGGVRVVAQGLGQVRSIAVDAGYVYVAHGPEADCTAGVVCTTLSRIPKAGGEREVLFTSFGKVGALEVDDVHLYWSVSSRPADLPLSEGVVMCIPKAGGTPRILADGPDRAGAQLALDGTHVYWFTVPLLSSSPDWTSVVHRSPR